MKWRKMGLVYAPDGKSSWAKHSALTPTPVLMDGGVIRVYAGFRDAFGVSRIGYVDLDRNDPSNVLRVSKEPVLDVGVPGAFDDNGVILGDVVRAGNRLHMFYVGFQKVEKVKFLAFSGLALSDDGGESFTRASKAPVLDRADEGLYIRAAHSVMLDSGVWRVWYSVGSQWTFIDGKPFPSYHIRYCESEDGFSFANHGTVCITAEGEEYRIGRPRVYKMGRTYIMLYTKGTLKGDYLAGCAESEDGVTWRRTDDKIGLSLSSTGWDSNMACYPSLVSHGETTYMFYNGNNFGEDGFGCAVLEQW